MLDGFVRPGGERHERTLRAGRNRQPVPEMWASAKGRDERQPAGVLGHRSCCAYLGCFKHLVYRLTREHRVRFVRVGRSCVSWRLM